MNTNTTTIRRRTLLAAVGIAAGVALAGLLLSSAATKDPAIPVTSHAALSRCRARSLQYANYCSNRLEQVEGYQAKIARWPSTKAWGYATTTIQGALVRADEFYRRHQDVAQLEAQRCEIASGPLGQSGVIKCSSDIASFFDLEDSTARFVLAGKAGERAAYLVTSNAVRRLALASAQKDRVELMDRSGNEEIRFAIETYPCVLSNLLYEAGQERDRRNSERRDKWERECANNGVDPYPLGRVIFTVTVIGDKWKIQSSPLDGNHFGLRSAPAERSGDGAMAIGTLVGASQSGVALRLPPHSTSSVPVLAAVPFDLYRLEDHSMACSELLSPIIYARVVYFNRDDLKGQKMVVPWQHGSPVERFVAEVMKAGVADPAPGTKAILTGDGLDNEFRPL